MSEVRQEKDMLGTLEVPAKALYGIHTVRALQNFKIAGRPVHKSLIRAFGQVKLACARVNYNLDCLDKKVFAALEKACLEMVAGELDEHVVVDALHGGAGTSLNMNVNEVLANRALQIMGENLGSYGLIHPIDHVNLHQSTNDTFPTALKVAAIDLSKELEEELAGLFTALQQKEQEFAHIVKVGRTQYQDAVPTTLGREMGAYAQAFSRDRWRIFKCSERLRVVNLGGTAIGTGLGAPRQFIFQVAEELRRITGFGLARAEDLVDATQNTDAFPETAGYLKTVAVNLMKVAGDFRLLSSGPKAGIGELLLPRRQAGSSIMPAKVNPVIPEAVQQAAMKVMSLDSVLSLACGMGSLELNAFMPLIADSLLNSVSLLTRAVHSFNKDCIVELRANEEVCKRYVFETTAIATILVDELGYAKVQEIVALAEKEERSLEEQVLAMELMTEEEFSHLLSAERVCRLGSPVKDGM